MIKGKMVKQGPPATRVFWLSVLGAIVLLGGGNLIYYWPF